MPRAAHGPRRILAPAALACALILAGCGAGSRAPASSPASGLVAIGAGLQGPAGLHASVYASGPLTDAMFALDSGGRLWITAAGLETHRHDGVYLVAREGAPAVQVIAGLDDPLGILWVGSRLLVSSVGRVDEYWDLRGTRFEHHRTILRGPLAGAENNGMVLARDGRVVMGVSATCDHCTPTSRWSGSIVSFTPAGGDLRLLARRVRAPIGLAYYPGTDELLATMNQRDDLGERTPGDWLAQVTAGQDWGFPNCYGQGGAGCESEPRPVAVLDKHGAVGSIAILTGQLAGRFSGSALVAEWNVSKLQRVALSRSPGGVLSGTVTPFITGIQSPLAVVTAPGGAVLAGSWATGTIYRITNAAA